jgi:hypothetical protein
MEDGAIPLAQLDPVDREGLEEDYQRIAEMLQDIAWGLDSVKRYKGEEARAAQLVRIGEQLALVEAECTTFDLSTRGVTLQREFGEKQKALAAQLKDCTQANARLAATGVVVDIFDMSIHQSRDFTTGQFLRKGIDLQMRDVHSLERQLAMINDSQEVARATISELARQEEQWLLIADNVSNVKRNLKRGAQQMRLIARKLAGDNLIRALCTIILLAILATVFIAAFFPSSASGGIFAQSNTTRVQ